MVGFDDVESAHLITPALTTIQGSPSGVGRVAVRKLIERIKFPDLPATQTLLTTSLIAHDSVKFLSWLCINSITIRLQNLLESKATTGRIKYTRLSLCFPDSALNPSRTPILSR